MSNKQKLLSLLLVMTCTTLLLVFIPSCTKEAPTDVWDLKLSCVWPEGHPMAVPVYHFTDLIAERTDGQVNITVYPGQQLVKMPDELTACSEGIIDMAPLVTGYFSGILHLSDGLNMPFCSPRTPGKMLELLQEIRPILEPEYTANNLKYLATVGSDMVVFTSGSNVKTLEDMKGRKFTIMPGWVSEYVAACGGAVANIPGSELYMALQQGIADGGLNDASAYLAQNLYDVTPYVTVPDMTVRGIMFAMNLDVWNSMPKDIQEIITECADEEERWMYTERLSEVTVEGLIDKFEEVGAEVYFLPDAERQRWVKESSVLWQKYLSQAGPDSQKLYDLVLKYQSE